MLNKRNIDKRAFQGGNTSLDVESPPMDVHESSGMGKGGSGNSKEGKNGEQVRGSLNNDSWVQKRKGRIVKDAFHISYLEKKEVCAPSDRSRKGPWGAGRPEDTQNFGENKEMLILDLSEKVGLGL